MLNAIKELLSSKKFLMTFFGLLGSIGVRFFIDPVNSEKISEAIIALVGFFLVGQGLSDFSKEAKKIDLDKK